MRCKICGGTLKLINGAYECENCHNGYEKISLYENIEVAICYVESDDFGRRTKDSVIAQEIYSRLESLNINAFYQRISVENLSYEEIERACTSAIDSAKILILLAGSKEHFSKLLAQNKELLTKKIIIPIYFDMNAYDMPSEISVYQAMNFDNVGAIEDLAKNILVSLGRNNEVDYLERNKQAFSKKKKITLITCITLTIILVCSAIYIVFGTSYVLPSKKYDKAEQLITEQKYVEAIEILDSLNDYKDTQNLLGNLYAQYGGYYHDNESNVGLHINTTGTSRADITITAVTPENIVLKIIESASITKNTINFEYNDSQNNQGTVVIEFQNNGIDLTISSDNEKSIFFALSEKSDQPITKEIDRATLLNWLETKISMSQIKALGYEIEEYSLMERDGLNRLYQIKNTDIILAMFGLDISEDAERGEGKELSDKILFGIMAPADIICPDSIGKEYEPFIEDDVLYWPGAGVGEGGMGLDMGVNRENEEFQITSNTQIGLTSKKILTSENWESIMEEILEAKVVSFGDDYYNIALDESGHVEYKAESNTHILFAYYAKELSEQYVYSLFKIDKTSKEVSFIGEVPSSFESFEDDEWQFYYPELMDEFPQNRYDY